MIITMQAYLKRGVQGIIKVTADEFNLSGDSNPQFVGAIEKGLVDYDSDGIKVVKSRRGTEVIENPLDMMSVGRRAVFVEEKSLSGNYTSTFVDVNAATFFSEGTNRKEAARLEHGDKEKK